jgi:hypothetical protein
MDSGPNIPNEKLVDIHIAEYNALTSRCTYFFNFQIILLTAILASISVIATLWGSRQTWLLGWGPLLVLLILTNISANIFTEQYKMVRYIETILKPLIKDLTKKKFWEYEPYLIRERKTHFLTSITLWEMMGPVIAGIILVFITLNHTYIYDSTWSPDDWIGLILSIVFWSIYSMQMYNAIKIRKIY